LPVECGPSADDSLAHPTRDGPIHATGPAPAKAVALPENDLFASRRPSSSCMRA
jgi:hypothetical protein